MAYLPKTGGAGTYYAPNDNSRQVKIVSICYLEEHLGINLFPQLSEEQKRNTYHLPLKATAVKAHGKPIEYSNWDAESQCAEEVAAARVCGSHAEAVFFCRRRIVRGRACSGRFGFRH